MALRTAGIGATPSLPAARPRSFDRTASGRSALPVGTGFHAPEPTFMSLANGSLSSHSHNGNWQLGRSRQAIESRVRLLRVGAVEGLKKPPINRGDEVAGFSAPAIRDLPLRKMPEEVILASRRPGMR